MLVGLTASGVGGGNATRAEWRRAGAARQAPRPDAASLKGASHACQARVCFLPTTRQQPEHPIFLNRRQWPVDREDNNVVSPAWRPWRRRDRPLRIVRHAPYSSVKQEALEAYGMRRCDTFHGLVDVGNGSPLFKGERRAILLLCPLLTCTFDGETLVAFLGNVVVRCSSAERAPVSDMLEQHGQGGRRFESCHRISTQTWRLKNATAVSAFARITTDIDPVQYRRF